MIYRHRLAAALVAVCGFAERPTLHAQSPLDFNVRLEPVWARVADVNGEAGSVESIEFSPDGKTLVSGTKYDNSVVMWRTSDGAELWRQYAAAEVERVGFSYDGKHVAACSEDFLVTVYDAGTGAEVKRLGHAAGVDGLTWGNANPWLASGEEHSDGASGRRVGYVRVFDRGRDFEEVAAINFGETVNELFFSPDDAYLLAVGHGAVRVYDTKDWSLARELIVDEEGSGMFTKFITGVFSPGEDYEYVLAAGINERVRGDVYLWRWRTGELVKRFNHTAKKIESVAFHPSGDYLAHVGHDSHVYIYRFDDVLAHPNDFIRVANKVYAGDHFEYIDFNADGSFLATAHQNGLIKLFAWMGEDPGLNERLHQAVKRKQDTGQ